MNRKQKIAFSRRFSLDDWTHLCGKLEFLKALEESTEIAEVVARRILDEGK